MEIDNQDTNDDPVDIKLRELKHLIGDYDARTFENIPEDYVYSLINIIKILEYLISNEYFRFNYRNNQIVNRFVFDAIEVLLLSGENLQIKTFRNEGLRIFACLIETTIEEKNINHDTTEYSFLFHSSPWAKQLNESFFTMLSANKSYNLKEIISEKDFLLTPTLFKLVIFTVSSIDLYWLHSKCLLIFFLEFLIENIKISPSLYLAFINSLMKNLTEDLILVGRFNNQQRDEFSQAYHLIIKSFTKLYKIYISDSDKKLTMNNTMFRFNNLLSETINANDYLSFGGINKKYLKFKRFIVKLMWSVINVALIVADDELTSLIPNLEFVNETYKQTYDYMLTITAESHNISERQIQNNYHDYLQYLIHSLKKISTSSISNTRVTEVEKNCLNIINTIVFSSRVNMEHVAMQFCIHLKSYWRRMIKIKEFRLEYKQLVDLIENTFEGIGPMFA